VNIDILGINKLKWTGMGEFNSDDYYIHYCGQESIRRKGVALIVNKRVQKTVLWCSLKNNRTISVHFQGKPLNITVTQAYAPTTNAKEACYGLAVCHLERLENEQIQLLSNPELNIHHREIFSTSF